MKVSLIGMTGLVDENNNQMKTECPEVIAMRASSICVGHIDSYTLSSLKNAIKSGHDSVIEHISFTFLIEGVSRSLMAQLTRSRIATFHVESQRYVKYLAGIDYVMPDSIKKIERLKNKFNELMNEINRFYQEALEMKVPGEDARYIFPNACKTNLIMTMNCRELKHFFNIRCCSRAQWEIRALANKMLSICKEKAPIIFENSGASCVEFGECKEQKSCGKAKRIAESKDEMIKSYEKKIDDFVSVLDKLIDENNMLRDMLDQKGLNNNG